MSQQVLVPIKGHDNIEEILPYLEDIARPDMKIVFLVHFGTNRFAELAGQLLEIQSGLPAKFSGDAGVPQTNFSHRIERVSRELSNRGVQIEVKFYSGRLWPILRQYSEVEGSKLVIMRPGRNRVGRGFQRLFSALLAKTSPTMPVVLCHPSNIARRSL